MANDLTGEFDVVAEFAIPAANRVLAAMHRIERFAHTLTVRVDDNRPPGTNPADPSIFGGFDAFGEAIADHELIPPRPPPGFHSTHGTAFSILDSVVNVDLSGLTIEPLPPSQLKGRAQLQLSPPSIDVTDTSGKKVTVRMGLMCRYFPDPQTPRVAQFVKGELQITAAVNEIASQVGSVVDIDIKGHTVTSSFTPTWSSEPISAEDLAGVNQLIRNSLRTSFLPSNATLPSGIDHVQFKTLRAAQNALAILLNMDGAAGNPGSQTNIFLGGADDFAMGAGVDFVRAKFEATLASIRRTHFDPVHIPVVNISYTISNIDPHDHRGQVSVDLVLENGRILLTIKGHAHTPHWWAPDFDFTVKQPLTLTPNGATAELVVGDISIDTTSVVADRFKNRIRDAIKKTRDRALDDSGARDTVRRELNAQDKLGGLLDSLLQPSGLQPSGRRHGREPRGFVLAYTSADIRPSGIVLHGSLAVTEFPAPHVEFERIPPAPNGGGPLGPGGVLDGGPDYTALKSWIPGGTIQRFEWSSMGHSQPLLVDDNRFVYLHPPPVFTDGSPSTTPVSGYRPLCLRLRGTRLSASGPVHAESVTASICDFTSFPIVGEFVVARDGALPMVALTHSDPRGLIQVAGQARAQPSQPGSGTPNLIVHFADERTSGQLDRLTQALRESGREDATTAILVVVSPGRLAKMRYTPGVIYTEDRAGWERVLGAKAEPLTLIVGPKRNVAWQEEGEIDVPGLAGALRKLLVAGGPVRVNVLRTRLRVGQDSPNFLFEHAPGRELTLRKLAGRLVTLVFWNSSSIQSVEAVLDAQNARASGNGKDSIVLAINDGEERETAKRFAVANGLSAIVVPDPKREISSAYGINAWPTIVSIDARGAVRAIRQGSVAGDSAGSPPSRPQRT